MTHRTFFPLNLALAAGLLTVGPAWAQQSDPTELHAHGAMEHDASNETAPAIELSVRPQVAQAGRSTTLTFLLRGPDGEPLDDALMIHHARKVHVVIVSQDMQVFGHVHPQDFAAPIVDGRATVRFDFPRGGRYMVAADIMTKDGPHSDTFIVDIAGNAAAQRRADDATTRLSVVEADDGDRYTSAVFLDETASSHGYRIDMRGADRVRAGEPARFSWTVERDGTPVTDLRPFLDAPLHLAVVKDDLNRFLHRHGEAPAASASLTPVSSAGVHGDAGSHGHDHAHGHGEKRAPKSFGPDVEATVIFPEPGRYHVFAQAAHGNRILVMRSTVLVQ